MADTSPDLDRDLVDACTGLLLTGQAPTETLLIFVYGFPAHVVARDLDAAADRARAVLAEAA